MEGRLKVNGAVLAWMLAGLVWMSGCGGPGNESSRGYDGVDNGTASSGYDDGKDGTALSGYDGGGKDVYIAFGIGRQFLADAFADLADVGGGAFVPRL